MKRCILRLALVAAALLLARTAGAQSRLYVFDAADGQYHRVVRVREDRPYILEKGELVPSGDRRFALWKADEYAPVFIGLDHKEVEVSGFNILGQGVPMNVNKQVHFKAVLTTPYWLDDVFLVLEMEFSDGATTVLVREVGKLEARTPLRFEADADLERDSAVRSCKVHLFSGGSEVFTSELPESQREEQLSRMIKTRLGAAQQAGPRPLLCPAPGYPDALKKSGVKGRAVVALRISPEGRVVEPSVQSATDPAFGESALAAVRDWRFVPGVREGQPVETRVAIPFGFDPTVSAPH